MSILNSTSIRKPSVPATGVVVGVVSAAFEVGVADVPGEEVSDGIGDVDDDGTGAAAATAAPTASSAPSQSIPFSASPASAAKYEPVVKSDTPMTRALLTFVMPAASAIAQRTVPPTATRTVAYTEVATPLTQRLMGTMGGEKGALDGDGDCDANVLKVLVIDADGVTVATALDEALMLALKVAESVAADGAAGGDGADVTLHDCVRPGVAVAAADGAADLLGERDDETDAVCVDVRAAVRVAAPLNDADAHTVTITLVDGVPIDDAVMGADADALAHAEAVSVNAPDCEKVPVANDDVEWLRVAEEDTLVGGDLLADAVVLPLRVPPNDLVVVEDVLMSALT